MKQISLIDRLDAATRGTYVFRHLAPGLEVRVHRISLEWLAARHAKLFQGDAGARFDAGLTQLVSAIQDPLRLLDAFETLQDYLAIFTEAIDRGCPELAGHVHPSIERAPRDEAGRTLPGHFTLEQLGPDAVGLFEAITSLSAPRRSGAAASEG